MLAKRASELFRQWMERVLVKMQDAIEQASHALSDQVATLRGAVSRLESVRTETESVEAQVTQMERASEDDRSRVGYEKILKSGFAFWAFATLLAIVEFMANFPVFRLLLPMNASLARLADRALEAASDHEWLAGLLLLFKDILYHLEAAVVAAIAVTVLVLLAKTAGSSMRPVTALSPKEHPLAAHTIRAHRRQHLLLFAASVVGVAFVLGFLYQSRDRIDGIAAERVVQSEASVRRAEAKLDSVRTDLTQVAAATTDVLEKRRTLERHRDDAAYARTIAMNNVPILFLNVALVLAAFVLGFSYKEEDLSDRRGEHPGLLSLRARLVDLRREAHTQVATARQAGGQARNAISRVHHLLGSRPLHDWQAKQDRLRSVIPLWRAENARLRSMDTGSIRAFRDPVAIEFAPVDEPVDFHVPSEFERLEEELQELTEMFVQLASRATPALGAPTVTGEPKEVA